MNRHINPLYAVAAVSILIAIMLGMCSKARAECLPSAAAVRVVHGAAAWSTWRTVGGRRCYALGVRPTEREVMQNDPERDLRHATRPRPARSLAGAVPLPPIDRGCSELCRSVREVLRIKADWDVYFADARFWGAHDRESLFEGFEAWRKERNRK